MADRSIRFLHAADLRLGEPFSQIGAVPRELRTTLIEAPWRAATRVFELALEHQVDFLVLSGNVLDLQVPDAASLILLHEQLEMLDQEGVAVYWASGPLDSPRQWPDGWSLPQGTYRFQEGEYQEVSHFSSNGVVATLFGCSNRGSLRGSPDVQRATAGPLVAVACGEASGNVFRRGSVHYWALGGRGNRERLDVPDAVALYAGTPQGRTAQELGAHGCELVEVTGDGDVLHEFIATDTVRRLSVTMERDGDVSETRGWMNLFNACAETLQKQHPGVLLVVDWHVPSPADSHHAEPGVDRRTMLEDFRTKGFAQHPYLWSLSVQGELVVPRDEGEDTLRGEFLRLVESMRSDHGSAPDAPQASSGTAAAAKGHPILDEVAILGARLLAGGDTAQATAPHQSDTASAG